MDDMDCDKRNCPRAKEASCDQKYRESQENQVGRKREEEDTDWQDTGFLEEDTSMGDVVRIDYGRVVVD